MNGEAFARQAAELVAANDRRHAFRGLLRHLRHAAQRVGIAWSALALAGFLLWPLPMNLRAA